MKNRLSDSQYGRLLSCIEGLHRCRHLKDFPKHSVAELRKLVACKMLCYAELDYARQRTINFFDPPTEYEAKPNEWFPKIIHQHPVLEYFKTGDGQALKISDFLGEEEFHALDLYQLAYRLTGAEDQMGFGVCIRDSFILGFAFDRGERSFTEEDRLLLNLIRPHVIQTYLHLEELAGHEQLQRDLQSALRESGLGVIVLNDAHAIVHATPGAIESLAGYIPVPESTPRLPEKLECWAFGPADSAPLILNRDDSRLVLRRVAQETRLLIMLSKENTTTAAATSAGRLARSNLTPRELEALHWIAEGKSNSEIAIILGISAGTAKLHVERILAKLGVENRTAAALFLRAAR